MTVTCPECGHEFAARARRGEGATYAKDWDHLPQKCLDMLDTWMDVYSKGYVADEPVDKVALRKLLAAFGLPISEDAMNARMSELLGTGLVGITQETRSSAHETKQPPKYYMQIPRVLPVLSNRGKL